MQSACIIGAYEHPTRFAPDKSMPRLLFECASGGLADAGLTFADVDGYFCAGDVPLKLAPYMVEYLGLNVRHCEGTESGGSSYIMHVGKAAAAIAAGKCSVALITLAGKPRSSGHKIGTEQHSPPAEQPDAMWDQPYGWSITGLYASKARRHMHEFGTTPEQLAWVKVAASHHAQHNPHAMLRSVMTVDDVLSSPMVSDPLHRADCCVISDGGGALVVARPEVAQSLSRPAVAVRSCAETVRTTNGGWADLITTGAAVTAPAAFAEARLHPRDVKYASIYDNFTIMVILQLEDIGFCKKGEGGRFVADGGLISGVGKLPWNTDGGGLCNNHPAHRGGLTKVVEAVRQLRGEAHPAVQVPNCDIALAAGPGGALLGGHSHATLLMERVT